MAQYKIPKRLREKAKQWEDQKNFCYLDIIISSGEIRKLFFSRCKELSVDPYSLALSVGQPIKPFKQNYVMTETPHCTRAFEQEKFIKMCELIGINIRVMVSQLPLEKAQENLSKHKVYQKAIYQRKT